MLEMREENGSLDSSFLEGDKPDSSEIQITNDVKSKKEVSRFTKFKNTIKKEENGIKHILESWGKFLIIPMILVMIFTPFGNFASYWLVIGFFFSIFAPSFMGVVVTGYFTYKKHENWFRENGRGVRATLCMAGWVALLITFNVVYGQFLCMRIPRLIMLNGAFCSWPWRFFL